MSLIKICGIRSLSDAQASLDAGADFLGFIFHQPSPRYIRPIEAGGIIKSLPRETKCVGVFVNEQSPEDVVSTATTAGIQILQLHGEEDPQFCAALKKWGYTVIKALPIESDLSTESVIKLAQSYVVDWILLDAYDPQLPGGTGKTLDWQLAREVRDALHDMKIILAGGLNISNIVSALSAVRPDGVDVASGVEKIPGVKDVGLVNQFIYKVRLFSKVK